MTWPTRSLQTAARCCAEAIGAIDRQDVQAARAAVAAARRALDHWGTAVPHTEAQVARLHDRPLVTDPILIAAEWLQLADDKLRGDVTSEDEPWAVREYLAQIGISVEEGDPPPGGVAAWLDAHRYRWPGTARVYVASALESLENARP